MKTCVYKESELTTTGTLEQFTDSHHETPITKGGNKFAPSNSFPTGSNLGSNGGHRLNNLISNFRLKFKIRLHADIQCT